MKNLRQKLLLLTAIAAVIWVGIDVFFSSPPSQEKTNSTLTSAIVESINKKLQGGSVPDVLHKQMSIALKPWTNDPFLERELIGECGLFSIDKPNTSGELTYTYSGYVQVGKKIFSIINKREYAEGELLEESNLQVFKNETDKVTLRDMDSPDDNPRLITIPIEQEPVFEKNGTPPQR